ncbi:MAG: GAF domain-containing protein [Chitinophagaceae bacterium]|nr:GAF domain-containing protein [Anaerolineae bacterium]
MQPMQLLKFLFSTRRYDTALGRYRGRVAYALLLLILGFYSAYALSVPEWRISSETNTKVTLFEIATEYGSQSGAAGPLVVFISLYLLGAVAYVATRRAMIMVAGWSLFFMWYFSGVLLLVVNTNEPGYASGAIVLMIVIGAVAIGWQGIIAGLGIALTTLTLRAMSSVAFANAGISVVTYMLQAMGASFVVYLLLRYANRSRSEGAMEAVEDRAISAEILSEIAQQISRRRTLNDVLPIITNRIIERFDFVYHAQVFMIPPEGHQARLVASTGPIGQKLIAASHGLIIGSQSVIGQVTQKGQPIVARAGSNNTIHRRNELLPDTAVEAAFPLRIGDKIIGALDLQSKDTDAFNDPNLLATFQALADSTALAIDNASQYETARSRQEENEHLVGQLRDALFDRERLNERLTGRAWSDYLRGARNDYGLDIDFGLNSVEPEHGLTPTLEEAIRINHFVQEDQDSRQIVAIPLRVRGQVVGAMEFELDKDRTFTPEDFDLVQEVGERFGLAAENARLLDESQRLGQREALVNQISSRLQTHNNVEATVTEAARSLREAIKAEKVTIRLGSPPATTSNRT